jgi:osmotically-inducible protein OsmY
MQTPPPKAEPAGAAAELDETGIRKVKRGKRSLIVMIIAAVVIVAGAAGFLYWKGILGNRSETVAANIEATVHEKGFDGVTVTINQDWVATVSGTVVGRVKRDELIALVQQDPNIKSVTDDLTVRPGPEELEQQVADALNARGLPGITVTVGNDLVAMLKGTVDDPSLMTVAVDTARGVSGLKDVQSAIKLSLAARQAALTQALAGGGFDQAKAEIVDENTVNLSGNVFSAEEKTKLVELVTATTGIATVNDTTQIVERPPLVEPGKVEADINRLLQKVGLPNVAAVVDEQLNATLVGNVSSVAERDKAIKTARRVATIKSLKSEIEVAHAAPAPSAAAVAETMASNAVKGQWVGRVDTGLFGYAFTLTINGGPIGQDVGTSVYGSGKGICSGTLTLAEASGSDFSFTENITHSGLMCPGGGTLKMKLSGDGKALFEWYKPKNPTKRYAKGVGERR